MSKVFIDCGCYYGGIIRYYRDWGIVDESWDIYVFEPNPEINTDKISEELGLPVTVIKEAVWVRDEPLKLFTGGLDNAAALEVSRDAGNEYTVKAIDFSEYLIQFPKVDICSMDIEGAEFEVLERLLATGVINKIKLLDIEFHHRLMTDYDLKDATDLYNRIKKCGVKIRLKVPLN